MKKQAIKKQKIIKELLINNAKRINKKEILRLKAIQYQLNQLKQCTQWNEFQLSQNEYSKNIEKSKDLLNLKLSS